MRLGQRSTNFCAEWAMRSQGMGAAMVTLSGGEPMLQASFLAVGAGPVMDSDIVGAIRALRRIHRRPGRRRWHGWLRGRLRLRGGRDFGGWYLGWRHLL